MYTREAHATREAPGRGKGITNQTSVRNRLGAFGVVERLVVPRRPGNSGGGKEPQFKTGAGREKGQEIGKPSNSGKCSEIT